MKDLATIAYENYKALLKIYKTATPCLRTAMSTPIVEQRNLCAQHHISHNSLCALDYEAGIMENPFLAKRLGYDVTLEQMELSFVEPLGNA